MTLSFKRLGDCIHIAETRNDQGFTRVLGINIDKEYIPTVANTSNADLSKYKAIKHNQFSTNIMHVGRDQRLPVALYKGNAPALVSPAYKVFEVNDENELDPDYLMLQLKRPEFDRYCGYICDSSIRGGLEWDRFCDIEIPIPNIDIQRKYVAVYNSLYKNQKSYEKSIDDLQLITDTYMDNLLKNTELSELGTYINQVDNRNRDLEVTNLKGISIQKKFIESKANMDGVSLSTYKVVEPGQFAYVTVTSRNGGKISIALNQSKKKYVISSTYIAFEIKNHDELMPEFLLLWFKRSEFDRYARFNSWGSARETFDWSEMQRVKLPIPNIEVQKSIVAIHHVLESRKRMNEKLKHTVADISPVLIRGVNKELEAVQV